jgi:hypothetical protein
MLKYEGFVKKIIFDWAILGDLFRVVLRLQGIRIVLNLGQIFFFFYLNHIRPLYICLK